MSIIHINNANKTVKSESTAEPWITSARGTVCVYNTIVASRRLRHPHTHTKKKSPPHLPNPDAGPCWCEAWVSSVRWRWRTTLAESRGFWALSTPSVGCLRRWTWPRMLRYRSSWLPSWVDEYDDHGGFIFLLLLFDSSESFRNTQCHVLVADGGEKSPRFAHCLPLFCATADGMCRRAVWIFSYF